MFEFGLDFAYYLNYLIICTILLLLEIKIRMDTIILTKKKKKKKKTRKSKNKERRIFIKHWIILNYLQISE
ncbi:hypothetical protein DR090_03140 [Mycoplasma hyopneumoniae]|nr:hypothetical protein [Mesomycoplasma hyopneumoniae]